MHTSIWGSLRNLWWIQKNPYHLAVNISNISIASIEEKKQQQSINSINAASYITECAAIKAFRAGSKCHNPVVNFQFSFKFT